MAITGLTRVLISILRFEYGDEELNHVIEIDDKITNDFNNFFPEDLVPGLENVYTSSSMKSLMEAYQTLIVDFIGKKYYEEKQKFNRGKHNFDGFMINFRVYILCNLFPHTDS